MTDFYITYHHGDEMAARWINTCHIISLDVEKQNYTSEPGAGIRIRGNGPSTMMTEISGFLSQELKEEPLNVDIFWLFI